MSKRAGWEMSKFTTSLSAFSRITQGRSLWVSMMGVSRRIDRARSSGSMDSGGGGATGSEGDNNQ